jgi:mono/diheme cytochrome c family protein
MRKIFLHLSTAIVLGCVGVPSTLRAESDPAKVYATNCALCHAANGSGDSAAGKALHAKDLRTAEVQAQSDAALAEIIGKGKGKMPAFAGKIPAVDLAKLATYVRDMAKQK